MSDTSTTNGTIAPVVPLEGTVESLGRAAVRLGFVTEQQVNEAAAAQAEFAQAGLRKKLGELLIEKKYIATEQLEFIVKNQTVTKKRIGDYELISKLGEGGMGAVYKARQMSMDRVVAVKILSPANAKKPDCRNRFESEARAVAKLNHPNIVTGIDAGHADGYYYFAMEFVDGDTLGQHLNRMGGKLEERTALKFIRQIALALQHAHANNLLHRDVKPDNILIDKKHTVAKLADLGLAREADKNEEGTTRIGQAVGTPFYMSPEQARGKDLTPATDFYSLGGTLFNLLTGQIPFTGATAAVIMARHITDPVPNPRVLEPSVSSETAQFVIKCLQKAPQDRFRTSEELIQEIDRLLERRNRPDAALATAKQKPTNARATREMQTLGKESTSESKQIKAGRKRKWRRRREDQSSALLVILLVVTVIAAGLIYAVLSNQNEQKRKNPGTTVLK